MVTLESPYKPDNELILFSEPLICTKFVNPASGSKLSTLFLSKQTYSNWVNVYMPANEVMQLLER